jgi:hypothetical protein
VGFLELIKGHITSLRSLTDQVFSDEGGDECSLLEDFLRSFNTLVSLTVKGHFLTSGAFSHHPNLKHFCLHTIESPLPDVSRKTLGGAGLYDLDINCPQLESLELDVDRDGEWVSINHPYKEFPTNHIIVPAGRYSRNYSDWV